MENNLNQLLNKLRAFRSKRYLILSFENLIKLIIIFSIVFIVGVLLESVFNFSSPVRKIIFYTISAITTFYFAINILLPLLHIHSTFGYDDAEVEAENISKLDNNIKDSLLNVIQISNDQLTKNNNLTAASINKIHEKTSTNNFNDLISFFSNKNLFIAVFIALFILITPLQFDFFSFAAERITKFKTDYSKPPKYDFQIFPGNTNTVKGKDVEILISPKNMIPEEVEIHIKSKDDAAFIGSQIQKDSLDVYKFIIRKITSDTEYFISVEDYISEKYKIYVSDFPEVSSFTVKIVSPAYSKIPDQFQKDNGNITVLKGGKAFFDITASKYVSSAKIDFSVGEDVNLIFNQNNAKVSLSLYDNRNYRFVLLDSLGNKNKFPIEYNINIIEDEYPIIEILEPEKNFQTRNPQFLQISSKITDDYGFSNVKLHYRLSETVFGDIEDTFNSISISIDNKMKDQVFYYSWNLQNLYLASGDELTYYLEVFDNDNISGPKSSKSDLMFLKVPGIDELYQQTNEESMDNVEDMEKLIKETEELNEDLEKLTNKLKKNEKELNWEEREEIETALKKFDEITKKAEDIQKNINELRKEMQKNDLLSEETLEKYMELQELMDKFNSPEMKNALEKLQEQLKNMNREQAKDNLDNMKFNEDSFKKSLERTLNLFKRIQIEQKIDEIVKRTEEIMKKQNEIMKDTENLENKSSKDSPENINNMQKSQENVSQQIEGMEKAMEELNELMKDMEDMPKEEMEKLLEEFKKQNNEELSDKSKEMMKKNPQQSKSMQQQLKSNMQQMSESMLSMQSQMAMQNQMVAMNKMIKTINNLIKLSKDQEKLIQNTNELTRNSNRFNENATEQLSILSNLGKIINELTDLSNKTFAISPELGKALGDAKEQMKKSMEGLKDLNSPQAAKGQSSAMKSLNEAAVIMQNSLQQMMQQGGGGQGMMSLMQQLQQMSEQQMNLNEMTRMLKDKGMSMEQRAQLQKLANEQQLIQKSIEELNRESKLSGDASKLSSSLEKTLEEMQEVITNMKTEKLDDELVQQQEKILSRMLDAQRSINERDFEKERKGNTGKEFVRKGPSSLNTDQITNQLRDEIMKAIKEGYSKDFEDLIRKYFQTLEEKKN